MGCNVVVAVVVTIVAVVVVNCQALGGISFSFLHANVIVN